MPVSRRNELFFFMILHVKNGTNSGNDSGSAPDHVGFKKRRQGQARCSASCTIEPLTTSARTMLCCNPPARCCGAHAFPLQVAMLRALCPAVCGMAQCCAVLCCAVLCCAV